MYLLMNHLQICYFHLKKWKDDTPLVQEVISYENQKSNLQQNFGHLSNFSHRSEPS